MKLGDWLKANSVTQEEFAKRIGVRGRVTVARYVAGVRIPDRAIMEAISRETAGAVRPNDFFASAPPAADGHPKASAA